MDERSGIEQTVLDVCAALTTAMGSRRVLVEGSFGSGRTTLCERVIAHPAVRARYGDSVILTTGLDWWMGFVSVERLRAATHSGPLLVVVDGVDAVFEPGGNDRSPLDLASVVRDLSGDLALLLTHTADVDRPIRRLFGPQLASTTRIRLVPPSGDELLGILRTRAALLEMCHLPYDPPVVELAAAKPFDEEMPAQPRLGVDRLDQWGARAKAQGLDRVSLESLPPDALPRADLAAPSPVDATTQTRTAPPSVQCPNRSFDRAAFVAAMSARVIGQAEAIDAVADHLELSFRGLRLRSTFHWGAALLLGRSGTGKSSFAEAMCDALGGTLLRYDGTEYGDDASRNCLIGAPPAYIGFGDSETLPARLSAIMEDPAHPGPVVVFFDEIEKMSPDVLLLLLQAMESGRLTDSAGVVADFSNTLFVMTSNLTAAHRVAGFTRPADAVRDVLETLKKDLPPEFIGRLDLIVEFQPLSRTALHTIVAQELSSIELSLRSNGYSLDVDGPVLDLIVETGLDPSLGARLLHRSIERHLLVPLARCEPGHYHAELGEDRSVQLVRVDPIGQSGSTAT